MALVVEDGTGLPNAEAYVSVADADAYHTAMGNTSWANANMAAKEAALRRATQYLDARYAFAGSPLTEVQALAWPRDAATWPVRSLETATYEAALRALTGALYVDQADAPTTRETIGPITVEYGASQNGGQVRLAILDDLLRGLLAVAGRLSLRLERAS